MSLSFADSPSVTSQCEWGGGGGRGVIKEEAVFASDFFFAKRTTFCCCYWEERKVRFFCFDKVCLKVDGWGGNKINIDLLSPVLFFWRNRVCEFESLDF